MSASQIVRAAGQVLQMQVRGEELWALSVGRALDRILEIGLSGIGNHVATVWCFLRDGDEMVCIARRERDAGYMKPSGRLRERDYPAYFDALRRESCIAVEDALSDPRTRDLVQPYLVPLGVHALLDANLRREGKVFGVVCFEQFHESRAWSEAERDLVAELAAVVNQLLLIDELRRRGRLLRMLNDIAPRLGRDHSVHDLARVSMEVLREQFGELWAAFFELDADGRECTMLAANSKGFPEDLLRQLRKVSLQQPTTLQRAITQRRIVVEAAFSDETEAIPERRRAARELGLRSTIGIPLVHNERALGCIVLWLRESAWFDSSELEAFESISTTVSVAFANALHLRELRHRARHDEVTALPNRDQLFEDLAVALPDSAGVMLVLADLRDFRQINDTLGRGLADRVLAEVAGRLRVAAAPGSVYRLAGAEFAVVIRGEALSPGARAAQLQTAIAAPLELGGLSLIVQAYCGIACASAQGMDAVQLVRNADVALGWARHQEEGLAEYRAELDVRGPRNLELLADLRKALREDGLRLHFQPKLELGSGRLQGCEALLRWSHPQHGNIAPDRFIAAAEAGNLMRGLTLWVADAAMRQVRAFRAVGLQVPIAINASVHNLIDESFPATIRDLLERHAVSARDLSVEITETVLMRDPERALPVIRQLAAMGIALDIDDFGTGYSSLAYLRQLPLAALKIDRTFVRDLTSRREDEVIVASTVGLAHGLGLKVIAEGVEDAATLVRLAELGCDKAQGYHISRPLPAEAFIDWARSRTE